MSLRLCFRIYSKRLYGNPTTMGFTSYLKKEPLVGFTTKEHELSFCDKNGLGTRKGGIIKEQPFSDLPHSGHVSGNFEKKIFI